MTPELLHVTYEGRQYDIPAWWIAGFCQRLRSRPERSILDAVRHWHEQALLEEQATRPAPHADNGFRCLVAHFDSNWKSLPPCVQCGTCGRWIRPENMQDACPGRPPARSNAPTTDDQPPTLPGVPAAGDRGLQGPNGRKEAS